MKNISFSVLFLLAFFLLPNTGNAQRIKGNGHIIDKGMAIQHFDRLEVNNAFKVELVQSGKEFVNIETDENIMPYVSVKVEHGKLIIELKKGTNIKHFNKLSARVGFNQLTAIELSGASELVAKGSFSLQKLHIDVSGASEIDIDLTADEVYVESSGASNIRLSGSTDFLEMDLSGASTFRGYELRTKECKVDASGASSVKVFATDSLDAEATGTSSIKYKGNPAKTKTDATQASSIIKK